MLRHHRSFACLFCVLLLSGCQSGENDSTLPPLKVVVTPVVEREVAEYAQFTGRTEAFESVDIRARVNGHLDKVLFKPGEDVEKGKPLFQIDPRAYKNDLERAEGEIVRVEARIKTMEAELERQRDLLNRKATSKADFDKAVGDAAEANAALRTSRAAAATAKLNFDFTKVLSPINGRISRNLIDEGNLVMADQTLLTNIVALDPMFIYFDVDERTMLTVQKLIREGKMKSARDNAIPVSMRLANQTGYPQEGVIDFVETRVDANTGTLRVRAKFANPPDKSGVRVLSPGLFGRIRLQVGPAGTKLLVPERAIGTDQGRKFVFVVNDKNEVQQRIIETGMLENGQRVAETGVKLSDRVIVEGVQRARAGIIVDPETK